MRRVSFPMLLLCAMAFAGGAVADTVSAGESDVARALWNFGGTLFGGGVVYGVIKQKLSDLDRRIVENRESVVRAHDRIDDIVDHRGQRP